MCLFDRLKRFIGLGPGKGSPSSRRGRSTGKRSIDELRRTDLTTKKISKTDKEVLRESDAEVGFEVLKYCDFIRNRPMVIHFICRIGDGAI